jgi:SAM-dependent methyltransferase
MRLTDLVRDFGQPPRPWVDGRTIPWDDPAFSRRMLAEHLSQQHDAASRRAEKIDRHVEFIRRVALPPQPARILDLGCGPGLYCHRLAVVGHDCLGIDFGPASIDYARSEAARQNLTCRFELDDIRNAAFGADNDLVILLFGELNLFPRDQAVELLRRCSESLAPGGRIILEVHSAELIRQRGAAPPKWSVVQSGLFSDGPHLRCDQSFWLEDFGGAAGRHWIIDAATSEVTRYGWTMLAYDDAAYESLLIDAGLRLIARYDSLTGEADGAGFPVLLAGPV